MKKRIIYSLLLMFLAVNSFAIEIWVSPKGKDSAKGTKSAPVKTLQQAVDLLSKQYKNSPFNEATIWMKSGVYKQLDVVKIDKSLFNDNNVKLTIASADKENAQISGGYSIDASKLKKVTDSNTLAKLNDSAASQILVADLKGSGLEKLFAQNTENGTAWDYREQNFANISWDEHFLQVAQWPNLGYAHIEEVAYKGPTTRWLKPGEKPAEYGYKNPTGAEFSLYEKKDFEKWEKEFDSSEDVLMQGFPHNDWFFQQEKVGDITDKGVKLLRYTRYGVVLKEGGYLPRRVKFVNLLCELDEPGEWYFDNQTKQFFVYPIKPITAKTAITILGGEKMLEVNGMEDFAVKNIIFENGGEIALDMNIPVNSTIAGCTFRNFNGRAFNVNGGKNSGVKSCDFYGLYAVGSINSDYNGDQSGVTGLHIDAVGKSRETLIPTNHYMVNNHIHDCRLRGYGLIGLNGVGIRFAHNLLHDLNGAVMYSGNDIILEYNEFYNMGWEMGDWNVAYIGADWASFGNEVRYNFVHHLMETPEAYPVEPFRNDDCGMGVEYHGNIFYKSGRGGVAFSGAGNGCYNNIALKIHTVYQAHLFDNNNTDKGVKERWNEMKAYDDGEKIRGDKDDNLWRAERFYGKMGWNFEPYASKYPTLRKIMNTGNPFASSYSVIENNYVDHKDPKEGIYIHYGSVDDFVETTTWEYPETITMDAFENPEVLDFTLKNSFVPMEGFKITDFKKIGMYDDEYRVAPNKDTYRKEIKTRFEGIPSNGGKYVMEEAYKRYPVPSYL